MERLRAYDWPGNVRQLVNTARRLTVTAPGNVVTAADLPEEFGGSAGEKIAQKEWTLRLADWAEQQLSGQPESPLLDTAVPDLERTLIRIALKLTGGSRQDAAKLLGWGRNTLTRKIRSLNLEGSL